MNGPALERHLALVAGGVSGVIATLGFMIIHDLWILDIWDMTGPMLFSGALTGVSLVWSYRRAVPDHSIGRWFGYNAFITALLVILGIASLVLLEPRFTMAEAMAMGDDALGRLLPPAVPLMIAATLIGTLALWAAFGGRRGAALPILVAMSLVVFFVGHQLAILGVVDGTGELIVFYGEFVALAVYLAATYAVGFVLLERLIRSLSSRETPTTAARP